MADPWEKVSRHDLAALTNAALMEDLEQPLPSGRTFDAVGDLSLRSVLLAAAHRGPDAPMAAGSGLEDVSLEDKEAKDADLEEVLSRFTDRPPKPVVLCSVTDSMVSGSWGLFEFCLGARGFLYYRPDWGVEDDESLPILGAWEPGHNQSARRACILRVYTREWENRVLPPAMGQWARGDPEVLQEAITRVLSAEPQAWKIVFERLRDVPGLRKGDSEAVEWIAQWSGFGVARVREVLQFAADMCDQSKQRPSSTQVALPGMDSFYSQDDQYWQRLLAGPLRGEVGCILVGLYVHCISEGGFWSW